jgi:hypothetical protein
VSIGDHYFQDWSELTKDHGFWRRGANDQKRPRRFEMAIGYRAVVRGRELILSFGVSVSSRHLGLVPVRGRRFK